MQINEKSNGGMPSAPRRFLRGSGFRLNHQQEKEVGLVVDSWPLNTECVGDDREQQLLRAMPRAILLDRASSQQPGSRGRRQWR